MARYSVRIKRSAAKEIEAVPQKKLRQQIVARIRKLGGQPRPPGCQKLTGHEKYRVRQGDYRILYTVEDEQLVVQVVKVGHRGDVYRT